MTSLKEATAVGIDLGTTQSVVAQAPDFGPPRVIPNAVGSPTTPSIVLFERPGHVVVGAAARSAIATDPEAVVQLVKRQMGSTWEFEYGGITYRPEHISALILRKLVADAGRLLGPVGLAVITVPAYFNDAMRLSTRMAASIAGLEVSGLLAEPTAAAIAFGYDRRPDNVAGVVVDLGGGTFDITVLDYRDGDVIVRAVGGDAYLGGANFDKVLFDYFVEEFRREHDFDLNDPEALSIEELTLVSQDWLSRAMAAKHDLSSLRRTSVLLQAAGMSLHLQVTADLFNTLSRVLLDEISEKIVEFLAMAGLNRTDIGVVLSVGGSSRIPAVHRRFADLLGREPETSVRPDEAVALGASLFAARQQLEGGRGIEVDPDTRRFLEKLEVADVSPHGIGVETVTADSFESQQMTVVLPRNSALGTPNTASFYTLRPDESRVVVALLEGDDSDLSSRIGEVIIADLPAGRPAGERIDVTIGYDADGILHVSAVHGPSGRSARASLRRSSVAGDSTPDPATAAVRRMTVS